ncbi:hypothetical protein LPJ66_005515, partial [Kickxella alabastrina]
DSWYYLAIGAGAALGTYRVLSHLLDQSRYELDFCYTQRQKQRRRHAWYAGTNLDGSADSEAALDIQTPEMVNSLAQLALHSDNFKLRDTASELLLDMAMRREMLQLIIAQAQGSSAAEEEGRLRAVVLLQVLVMTPQRVSRVVRAGGIEALVDAMRAPREKEVATRAAATLLGLLDVSDAAVSKRHMRRAAGCGLLEVLSEVLLQSANGSPRGGSKRRQRSDAVLVSVCAAMAKQFALRTEYHRRMIDLAFLPALLGVARQSVAELELLRALMESLVRLCTFLTAYRPPAAEENAMEVANPQMVQLLELGAVDVIAACIRQDDQGVSSWGIGFLHEFVSRSVGKAQLAASPGLVRWLCRRLATGKYAYTNQLILRSLWCLCTTRETAAAPAALAEVAQPENLRRVLAMFVSDDDAEAHYWSVALISRVSVLASTHRWIIRSPLPQAMAGVAEALMPDSRLTLMPEMAGIISRLCHSIDVAPMMAECPTIATMCIRLLAADVESAHLSAIMAVINATATSRGFLRLLMADDAIKTRLVELVLTNGSSSGPTQSYAAKGLVALMYAGQVEAKGVVCNVLAPLLRQMESMYLNNLELAFYPVSDSDEALSEIVSKGTKLGQRMNAALVLFSAMQVMVAQQGVWTDSNVLAFDALGYFQMGLLGQLAAYIRYSCGLDADLMKSLGIWSSAVNMGVDAVVASYYVVVGEEDDAHCRACRKPAQLSQEHKIHMEDISSERPWFSAVRKGRRLGTLCGDDSKAAGVGGDFPLGLRNTRLRSLLPMIQMTMGVLADSLLVAGLEMQSPEITRRLLYLLRILGRELPPVLRGLTLRALAAINVYTLCRSDAFGLLRMCAKYLRWEPMSAADLADEVEEHEKCLVDDLGVRQQQLLEGLGVCFDDSRVPAARYFDKFPEAMPPAVARFGEFYAQFAIDRFAAGWRTGAEMFASAGNDKGVDGFGDVGLVVNRSGPRGTAIDCGLTEVPKPVPATDILFSHLRIKPSSAAAAAIVDNAAAAADEPHLLYSPYYPSFSALLDGKTVWNSSWKFESVVTTTYIQENVGGKHSFHVRLLTGGLMQIGWCSDQCGFFPESGEGVGDDLQSVSYDGMRMRKWHGTATATATSLALGEHSNQYGEKWEAGDVIGTEIDLDCGSVEFYRNGQSMGMAFERGVSEFDAVDKCRRWLPAVSLASEQGLVFLGPGVGGPLRKLTEISG